MTVTRRRLTFALTAALLLSPLASADAATPPTLVLTSAAGSRHTTVTFTKDVVVKRADWYLPTRTAGCGRFGGWYLQPVVGRGFVGTGAVDVALFGYGPRLPRMAVRLGEQAGFGSYLVTVPAGRYRAHVLGEGRCEVRLPVVSGFTGTRKVVTSTRTSVDYAELDLMTNESLPGRAPAGLASFPLTVTSRSYVVVAGHLYNRSTTLPPTAQLLACLDDVPAVTCGSTSDGVRGGWNGAQAHDADGTAHSVLDLFAYALPGALPPGTRHGNVRFDDLSGPVSAVAAVFVFQP